MKTFDVDFEMQYRVEVENPDAIQAYFIEGDWKDLFWEIEDLEDFVRSLTLSFDRHPEYWDRERGGSTRMVEGFGEFNQKVGEPYRLVPEAAEELGTQITIRVVDELEPMFVTERKE